MHTSGQAGTGYGGGIYNKGLAKLMNVTLGANIVTRGRLNSQPEGAGLGANLAHNGVLLTLRNTLIAYPVNGSNCWGPVLDEGYNISSDGSAAFNSGASYNFTDPKLAPLGDYGGPTRTMALLSDSPAIDFGSVIGAPMTDQRGAARRLN